MNFTYGNKSQLKRGGLVKEYDSAYNLLQKDNSLLATMVDALGNGVSNSLRSLAKEAADETKRV